MSIHREISFEREICEHLAANGWLYAEGDAARYDRARALFPDDVLAWLQTAHSDAWAALEKSHGAAAGEAVLSRLRDQLDQRGTLEVLRHGIEMLGLRARLPLAQFRPAMAATDEILARYSVNRLRVVRQVRYSLHGENCIDLVLFLNGVAVATAELKTDFTQGVQDAVDQYRFDRPPRTAGKPPEPLLSCPGGALVHFAVSNHEVQMATKLEGPGTRFLPFNRGNDGGKGNPPDPTGHPTGYLWEEIWARDGRLEILGRYLVAERNAKKEISREYQILLVANKFQTGFDEPLLCGMYVDRRLAGIQAVQTLSRLNRAYPGKDTTYVVDFVNEPAEILEAFQTYYTTAYLTDVTDPHLVCDLRAKLDGAGHYDDHELERVVAVELKPGARQGELVSAIEPVVDRLVKRYRAAQDVHAGADADGDRSRAEVAQAEMESLTIFRADMATFVRLYTYLSQIFDYGNTEIEKRAIFFRRLLPLLEFGRERERIDLSRVVLTHHTLKTRDGGGMILRPGGGDGLPPASGVGTGRVQERQKAHLREIIDKLNDLFSGELSEQDKLVYVNDVLKGNSWSPKRSCGRPRATARSSSPTHPT